jgi:hypothetical protein
MGVTCHYIDGKLWVPKQVALALRSMKGKLHTRLHNNNSQLTLKVI